MANGLANGNSTINHIRDEDLKSLIARKKLRLVLDLDNTLLDTKHIDNLYREDKKYKTNPWTHKGEKLYKGEEFVTKLRPYTRTFLEEASSFFELSIFTLGSREYAKKMVDILDPQRQYFTNSSQVITREDCTNPNKKGLNLVRSHERVTLVIDDRPEFWVDYPKNLITIEPYLFFHHPNAPKTPWSWLGDECVNQGALAVILRRLKKIHAEFYKTGEDYESRDVRDAVDEVRRQFMFFGTKAYFESLRKNKVDSPDSELIASM